MHFIREMGRQFTVIFLLVLVSTFKMFSNTNYQCTLKNMQTFSSEYNLYILTKNTENYFSIFVPFSFHVVFVPRICRPIPECKTVLKHTIFCKNVVFTFDVQKQLFHLRHWQERVVPPGLQIFVVRCSLATGVWEPWRGPYAHVESDYMFTSECHMKCLSLKYKQLLLSPAPRMRLKHEKTERGCHWRCKINLAFIFQQIICIFNEKKPSR